uniref:MobA-like NTP transferase domain-containing protein n=1 Tax=Xiphophorus couchianus TaxID=32473 RepID=A0A3B5MAB7_9TELE
MKAVILAAGYGTRLQRDVSSDRSGRFAHLVGVPKPLLPVGRSPLISRWVRALTRSGTVDGIYVVVGTQKYSNHVSVEMIKQNRSRQLNQREWSGS